MEHSSRKMNARQSTEFRGSAACKVVVAIPTNGNDGREQMSGVFDWLNEHPRWEIQLINSRTDIANGGLENAVKWASGILLSIACDNEKWAERFRGSDMKIVVTNDHLVPLYAGRGNCRSLLLDSTSIGGDAAAYFASLGRFASYGFVHGPFRYPWSQEREEGFRRGVPRDAPFFVYPAAERGGDQPPVILQSSLAEWLETLPKPAAVFGANDLFASEVIMACARLGIGVPKQVAVIGCDNDPMIWQNTRPQLTSMQLPFRKLGYRAAETLDRMLRGDTPRDGLIRVSGTHMFVRGSSAHLPPATVLIEKAREFIAQHACDGIRVGDVVAHTGVSRSLLNLRFRQTCGKSILEEITDVRLGEVRRRLAETKAPIMQIGQDCGFNRTDHLKRLFKRRYGMSMREYRKSLG